MTARREVFWVEVGIIVKTMGKSSYEKPAADVVINQSKKRTGLLLISDNRFFTRVWFLLSNPFRYIFTGKIRY